MYGGFFRLRPPLDVHSNFNMAAKSIQDHHQPVDGEAAKLDRSQLPS